MMGVKIFKKPQLKNPVLIASWPGIGNIGLVAVDTLREVLGAEEFGEIEPWDFFYPRKVLIRNGELQDLVFPTSKFYFKRMVNKDLIIFVGEEQPTDGAKAYATGAKAYQMANMVVDVGLDFGCTRIFTSGAAVSPIHHAMRPRVWAVPNSEKLVNAIKGYDNTVLMSNVEGRGGQGSITGLNGLLLGIARMRGLDAICVMGEIPIYLQSFPILYPKASKSVLEVLSTILGVSIDLGVIDEFAIRVEREIDSLYEKMPSEIKEQLDKLRHATYTGQTELGSITEDDKKKIMEDIDKLFKKTTEEDEN
jgi:proteasome assembly chaperone (PAC2) family protein